MTTLAPVLEQYFTAHLLKALNASSHTIAAYRDTWRILIRYTTETSGIRPGLFSISGTGNLAAFYGKLVDLYGFSSSEVHR